VTLLAFDSDPLIIGHKTIDNDGYSAVIIGFYPIDKIKLGKNKSGIFNKNNLEFRKFIVESRVDNPNQYSIGSKIGIDIFSIGDALNIKGISIGKGFSGVMKRHNFSGLRATHGVSLKHRSGGSIGGCQDPGRVFKGAKMAGRSGGKNITVKGLSIRYIDYDCNVLAVNGSIPGYKGGILRMRVV